MIWDAEGPRQVCRWIPNYFADSAMTELNKLVDTAAKIRPKMDDELLWARVLVDAAVFRTWSQPVGKCFHCYCCRGWCWTDPTQIRWNPKGLKTSDQRSQRRQRRDWNETAAETWSGTAIGAAEWLRFCCSVCCPSALLRWVLGSTLGSVGRRSTDGGAGAAGPEWCPYRCCQTWRAPEQVWGHRSTKT